MLRRQFLQASALAGAAAAFPLAARAAASAEDARLAALLDAFFYEGVDENPQGPSSLGLDKGARQR